MKALFAKYADAMDAVSEFIGKSCSVLFFVCIAVSAAEVVMRYGLDRPSPWATELSMTLCACAWVLSVGYVTQRSRHISITMAEMLVGEKVWRYFRLFQLLISFGAVLVLTFALWGPMLRVLKRTEYSGTAFNSVQPTILKIVIVAGCALYLLQLVANIVRWAQGREEVGHGH